MLINLLILLTPFLLIGLVWYFVRRMVRGRRRVREAAQAAADALPQPIANDAGQWFLVAAGREHGPFGLEQFQRFRERGMVSASSVLREAASGRTVVAATVPGLFAPLPPEPEFVEQPVEFQTFGGQRDPLRLGKGTVRVRGGQLIVLGRRRRMFAFRRREEVIPLSDIHDVAVAGRVVTFRAEGQASKLPRMLRMATVEAAQALAACLPERLSVAGAQAKADALEFARFLGERHAVVTLAIIAVNLLVYVAGGIKGAGWMSGNAGVLYEMGGNLAPATALGQWWRLLTSMFLHAGLFHVLFNMWALWDAGRIAERLFGHGRYAIVYLAAGLLGGIASINWQQEAVGVGASGAVFGVYGALLAALTLRKDLLPLSVAKQMTASMTFFVMYSLFNGFTKAGVDNAAHLGGLLAGAVLGAGIVASTQRMWAAAAATVVMLGMGAARAIDMVEPVRDETAFRAWLVSFEAEEKRLNEAAQKLFAEGKHLPATEVAQRLDPVVSGWKAQEGRIGALTRVTSRSRVVRDPLAQFIGLRHGSLIDLREGLRRDDPQLVASGKAKLDQANAVIEEMKRTVEAENKAQAEKGKK